MKLFLFVLFFASCISALYNGCLVLQVRRQNIGLAQSNSVLSERITFEIQRFKNTNLNATIHHVSTLNHVQGGTDRGIYRIVLCYDGVLNGSYVVPDEWEEPRASSASTLRVGLPFLSTIYALCAKN